MSKWHPLVDPKQKGATAESNFDDIMVIRQLPKDSQERQDAVQAMAMANIPFVITKVNMYISLEPSVEYMYDDLVSEGFLCLVEAITKLADLETPEDGGNPTGFIGQLIVWKLARLIYNEEQQVTPHDYQPPGPNIVEPMAIIDTRDFIESLCWTNEEKILIEMREAGCTDEEIAARFDIPRRAVGHMRHELMQRYKIAMEELE